MTSSRHHNVYQDGAVCFWTSSVVGFVPVFTSRTACLRLLSVWDRNRVWWGVRVVGYVIMPNHIHLALWSEEANQVQMFLMKALEESSRAMIDLTSAAAEKGGARTGGWLRVFEAHAGGGVRAAFWKERGRAFPVSTGDGLRQKLRYMHENPVRKGLCETAEDWGVLERVMVCYRGWSACDRSDGGMVDETTQA